MVSQQFARMAPHDDEAEILRGGLFLSYGLHREAGEVFAKLIERRCAASRCATAPGSISPRSATSAVCCRKPRKRWRASSKPLPGALEEDRVLLQANVLMARTRYAEAARVLEPLGKVPGASSYARYNLGVALIRSGDIAGRHARARPGRQASGHGRGVPQPARQGERRARLRVPEGRPGRRGTRVPRTCAPVRDAVEQGVAGVRVGRRGAGQHEGGAGAVERTGRARSGRPGRARGQAGGVLRARRTRRRRAGAGAVPGRDRHLRPRVGEPRRIDRRDPRRHADRRPDRPQPGRGNGLVLEHRRTARRKRAAAWRAPRAGAGEARVPGSLQELPRPAVPRAQRAAVAGQPRRDARHAGESPPGLRASGCRRCRRRNARCTLPRPDSGAMRW